VLVARVAERWPHAVRRAAHLTYPAVRRSDTIVLCRDATVHAWGVDARETGAVRLESDPSLGKQILIVDDSVEYLNFMQLLLRTEGFNAEVASSVAALEQQLEAATPDLIISDVRMPGNCAFAVLDLLRSSEQTRNIPILLCTGAVQEVKERAGLLESDRIDVLFKPFDIEVLLGRITRLCQPERLTQG
jgi:twitching motility two-component system response regulator PilH